MKARPYLIPSLVRNRRAFTLFEVMVASGVTILILSVFLIVTNNSLRQWNRIAGKLTIEQQASVALEQLSTDLSTAVVRRDGRVWLAATIQTDQTSLLGDTHGVGDSNVTNGNGATLNYTRWTAQGGGNMKPYGMTAPYTPNALGSSLVIPSYQPPTSATQPLTTSTTITQASNLPDLNAYRFGQAGVWLRMFVPVPDSNDGEAKNVSAAYRAVSYQIVRMRQTATSQSYRYYLFRSTVRPFATTQGGNNSQSRSTFGAGYDFFQVFNTSTLSPTGTHTGVISIYNNPSNAGNSGGSGATGGGGGLAQDDAGNIRQPNMQQVIANNIIDFGVRFWGRTRDANGKPMEILLFPASRNFASTPNTGFAASTEDGFTRRNDLGLPVAAIQPSQPSGSSYTGWIWNTAYMTYAFAYNSNGTPGPVTASAGRPCELVYADIFLRVVDDDGARMLDTLENGTASGAYAQAPTTPPGMNPGEYWWRIAEQHSRVITRRVRLLGVQPM